MADMLVYHITGQRRHLHSKAKQHGKKMDQVPVKKEAAKCHHHAAWRVIPVWPLVPGHYSSHRQIKLGLRPGKLCGCPPGNFSSLSCI